ncbi:hypothetical protein NW762_014815 [Fusarium torreyae]|uniref:Uncharacterized protein n=1 Tax=Fusarium torreyae TaxID=1237075 RepID=A0A9W8RI07_9HYPO|nr:hypothetical protein NW762_014815 [Fusarium torreyae]
MESLQKFEKVSGFPDLASSIRKLEVYTFYLPPLEDLLEILAQDAAESFSIASMEDTEINIDASHMRGNSSQFEDKDCPDDESYCKYWEGQQQMIDDNQIFRVLSKGMKSLTKCRKNAFNHNDIPWSNSHRAEGLDYLSKISSPTREESSDFVRRVVQDFLTASYESRLQLDDVDIHAGSFMDDAHCIIPNQPPCLENSISSLCRLYLHIDPSFEGTSRLGQFISCFPKLTDFGLETFSNLCQHNPAGILLDITIPDLAKLSLSQLNCTADELENFFLAHSETLREINLVWVELDDTRHWRKIMQILRGRMPSVKLKMDSCVRGKMWEADSTQELIEIMHESDE